MQYSHDNICDEVTCYGDSNICVFLWILRNSCEQLLLCIPNQLPGSSNGSIKIHRYLSLNPTYLAKVISSSVMCYVNSYHLYNLKNVKNTHGGVLLLIKLQAKAKASNFTKSNTPPWVFFTFSKLCKWYRIAQCITSLLTHRFDRTQHNRLRCSSPQTEHKCSPPTLALHL